MASEELVYWRHATRLPEENANLNGSVLQALRVRGIGILNLVKFDSSLRMIWLWHQWNDESKPWIGLGKPTTGRRLMSD
jgi:hypothetical protein